MHLSKVKISVISLLYGFKEFVNDMFPNERHNFVHFVVVFDVMDPCGRKPQSQVSIGFPIGFDRNCFDRCSDKNLEHVSIALFR